MTNIVGNTFGARLRSLRERRGLTQAELGEPITTKSFVSQIERDVATPSLTTLQHFARKLKVPVSVLFGEQDYQVPPPWILEELADIAKQLSGCEQRMCTYLSARLYNVMAKAFEQLQEQERALDAYRKASEILSALDKESGFVIP